MDVFETGPPPLSSIQSRKSGVHELQKEVDRLRLLVEVLVRALVEKGIYTRDQLNALANLVDMEDGVRDGRIKPKAGVKHCANCGRVRMDVSGKCLYCEHEEVLELI
jgi:hypothetical protein